MELERSDVQKFLWWVSCTDPEALELCSPVTRFYQTTAGIMILITGVLALISGSYAISQIVHASLVAVLFGCIYAIAIVSIDRFIISARGGKVAFLRLPLAAILGCIVAVPLELRLLEDRINKELVRQEHSDNQEADDLRASQRDDLQKRISVLEQSASEYRNKINEWGTAMEAEIVGRVKVGRTGLSGEGPAYRAAFEQKQLNTELLRQVGDELQSLRQKQASVLEEIDKEYERVRVPQAHDLLARYEAMHVIEREHPEAAKMTWAITLLFIAFEMFPALLKMTMPYTAYSALVEAREREDIQRTHSIGNRDLAELVNDPENPKLFVLYRTATIKQNAENRFSWRSKERERAAGA